jgi:hypothetical protein
MDRRTYLSLTATATLAGAAGCQDALSGTETEDDDDDDDDTSTPGAADGSVAAWRRWIPAELVVGTGAEVLMLDTNRAKSELPAQTYEQFQITQIASALGVEESNIDRLTGVQRGDDDNDVVLTGSYTPSEILEALEVSDSEVSSYQGYQIIEGQQFAIGTDAILLSQNYETLIDTHAGARPYLGQDDADWNQLLTSIQDATLAVATPGTVGDDSSIQADKSGVTVDAAEGSGARIAIYVHFGSESDAEAAMETAREEFVDNATGNSDVDIQRFERQGSRIIVEGTTPNFDF